MAARSEVESFEEHCIDLHLDRKHIAELQRPRFLEGDTAKERGVLPLPDMNTIKEVEQDIKGLVKYFLRCPKRRAFPDWSLPAEIWLMILLPNFRKKDSCTEKAL